MCSSLSRFASLSTHSFACLNRNAADLILHRASQSPQISTIVWTTARRGRPRSSTSVRDALPSAPASVSAGLRLVPRRLQSSPRQPPCSSLPRALSTSPHAGVVYQHGLTHIPASKNACRRFHVRNQSGHGRGRGCGPYLGFVSERGYFGSHGVINPGKWSGGREFFGQGNPRPPAGGISPHGVTSPLLFGSFPIEIISCYLEGFPGR
jgi:hypothetical protein